MSFFGGEYDYETDIAVNREEAFEDGFEKGIEKGVLLNIQSIMNNLNMTAEQTMDSIDIPAEKQAKYLKMLSI